MKRYNIISFIFMCVFLLLFNLMASGVTFGSFDKIAIVSMILFPLVGVGVAFKGEGWIKWILVTLHTVVLAILVFAFVF